MLKLLKPRHASILGLDISSQSIKGVELLRQDNTWELIAYGSEPLPFDAVEGHAIRNIEAVAQSIRQLALRAHFKSKLAVTSLPDTTVFSKVLTVNEGLNENEMEEYIVLEAEKYIPFPIQEVNLDFHSLGPSVKNPAMIDVLIAASRTENVISRLDAVSKAGLQLKVMDVDSFAIERAIVNLISPELPQQGKGKLIAVFNIGARFSNLYILNNLKIIFTREEEFGGGQLEEELKQNYGERAQEMQMGKPLTLPEDFVINVLAPFMETLTHHVKRSLQFFFSTGPFHHVDHILMAGGIAKLPQIVPFITEKINIPTSLANPFNKIKINEKLNREEALTNGPSSLIACGLAIRAGIK